MAKSGNAAEIQSARIPGSLRPIRQHGARANSVHRRPQSSASTNAQKHRLRACPKAAAPRVRMHAGRESNAAASGASPIRMRIGSSPLRTRRRQRNGCLAKERRRLSKSELRAAATHRHRRAGAPPPRALSIGGRAASATTTSNPFKRAAIAAASPAGPPPITKTSVRNVTIPLACIFEIVPAQPDRR
jgi:hypothetical protein